MGPLTTSPYRITTRCPDCGGLTFDQATARCVYACQYCGETADDDCTARTCTSPSCRQQGIDEERGARAYEGRR